LKVFFTVARQKFYLIRRRINENKSSKKGKDTKRATSGEEGSASPKNDEKPVATGLWGTKPNFRDILLANKEAKDTVVKENQTT